MVGSQRKFVRIFDLRFFFHIEMPIPFSFGIVVILILFEFVELMGLLESIIIFAINGHVTGNGLILGDLLEFDVGSDHESVALFLNGWMGTLTCSL